jgi:hypothetical protein
LINTADSKSTSKPEKSAKTTPNDDLKCRVNLSFTNSIECYVTPLILCCLERYVKALKAYKLNPHTLLTEVDAKSQIKLTLNFVVYTQTLQNKVQKTNKQNYLV